MTTIGIGVDVVDLGRVERALSRFGDTYLAHLLTERERQRWPLRDAVFAAAAIGVKEASYKACGAVVGRCGWHDIELDASLERADVQPALLELIDRAGEPLELGLVSFVSSKVCRAAATVTVEAGWARRREAIVAVAIGSSRAAAAA